MSVVSDLVVISELPAQLPYKLAPLLTGLLKGNTFLVITAAVVDFILNRG
jgi:hypothetical protein